MPVLKKVPSYIKNVAKSVAYSAVDVVKTDMPTVSAFLDNESNKEVGKIVFDNIKDLQSIRMLGRNTALALQRSKVWEAGELGIKSALEDIRTGKWYNKERISMIEEEVLKETMGGWDDMDLDMDSMEFGASDEPTKGDKLVSASVQIAVGKSADQISETTINAASAIMSQQRKSTELLYAQNFKLANEMRATVTNIGNKTNVYLDNIQSLNKTIAENNKKFFDVSTKLMQENNSMMKEMIAMQRNLYRNQQEIEKQNEKSNSKQKPGYSDLVSMEGVLDVKEYGKFVKGNAFKVLDEQSGGMLSMMFGGFDGSGKGNMIKSFASSPLSFMSNMIMSQMMPKNVKKSAGKLDSTIGGIIPTLLGGLNKAGKNSDNPLAQIVGKILGVDTRVQNKIDTSKYEKGPMQYNGKANKSLTEVIPELLSDILSTLSGAPKKLYDFDKGRWTTGRAIKREYDQMTKNNMKSSFSDLLSEMKDYMGGSKAPKFSTRGESDRFEQTLETFLTVLYNNDGSFNSKKDYDIYQMAGIAKSDYDMISKMIQNIGKRNHGVRMGLSASVMSNKQSLNNQVKNLQDKGSIFSYLFNGTDSNKLYKTPKYENEPIGVGLDLNKTLDDKGNNIFYYLQNMYDEMYRIRMFGFGINGRSGWNNGNAPGKPFNESIYNISRIENNHKRSPKERYLDSERSNDARYQKMLDNFTKKGGKLYDLVDDRGNINLINATAEQKQIADMLEQARSSGGFLQDTLFGTTSALDRDNLKRSKNDQSQINAKKFLDRLKQSKTLEDKFKVLSDQAKRGTRGSANVTANMIARADDAIYEFFFGGETGDEDDDGKTIKGFMSLMKNKLNNALDKGLGFIDEKIMGPIKKKTGNDSIRDWFLEKTGIKGLFESAKHWLLGDEGQKNGFLHSLGEETKSLFSKAGGFVGNSFKTVFAPVTDRVKAGWQKMTTPTGPQEVEVSPEEYLNAVRSGNSGLDTSKSYSLGSIAMRLEEYGGRAKKLAHSLILAPYNIDTIEAISSYLDGMNSRITNLNPAGKENIEGLVKSFVKYKKANSKKINEINNSSSSAIRERIENKKRSIQYKKDHPGYDDPNTNLAEDYATEDNAEAALRFAISGVPIMDRRGISYADVIAKGPNARRIKDLRNKEFNTSSRKLGTNIRADRSKIDSYRSNKDKFIDANKKIKEMAINILNNLNLPKRYYDVIVGAIDNINGGTISDSKINAISKVNMTDLHRELNNIGTPKALGAAQKIESAMMNAGNMDMTIGKIMGTNIRDIARDNNPINSIGGINSVMSETMIKLYDLINSIIDNASKAIRIVPARIRTNSAPLGGNINSRGSRGREPESEGRSSGSDDGGVGQAAYGANFNKAGISALSEGEIYGNNGLYGKVPNTGVYNIKSGTTVYPTKKDKAIELANEQDVINKIIYSNANAKGQATRQINGDTYTEVEPGVWMAWVQDDKGRQKQRWIREDDEINLAQKTAKTAKSGAQAVITGLGLNSQIGSMTMPKNLEEAKALVSKYAPKVGAGVILGGAIGLLAGNPMLGASIGGTASIVSASEQAKTFLFGEQTKDAEGNDTGRTGGLISSGAQDAIKKYFPSMAKYGTVGAGLGLLSPFGLVGGALIGSSIGWATSNDAIREALFGKSDDPKSGLMSQETRNKLKKAMPNMVIGAGLGIVTGPFGILGNALLGSGLGLVSTTEGFKSFIFGTEYVNADGTKSREGGLVGSIKKHVVDPLKDFGGFFKNKMEDMFINGIINPIKDSIKPLSKDFYLLAKNALGIFPNMVNALFDSTFGRPLTQLIDDKIISPISNITNKLARGAVGAGAGLISAPFKAVRGIARSRQSSHIRTGNADYMTAADRLQFRKDHKIRSIGGDAYQSTDEIMNLMNKDQLKSSLDSMKVLQNVGKLRKDEKSAGRALSAEVTKYFGTKGNTWRKFKAAMESNSVEQFSQLLDVTPMANGEMMSQAQKDQLLQLANAKLEAVHTSRQKQNLTKDKEKDLFRELKQKGFNVNSKNVDKISTMLQNEYNIKSKSEKQLTPEEQAANTVTDAAKKNTEDIINTLKDSTKVIADILANNAPDTATRDANKKFVNDYFAGPTVDRTTGEEQSREERRQKELEEAQSRARSGFQETADKGKGWWNKVYGNAKQYAHDLANPKTIKREAYIDGTDIPVQMEEIEETNVPGGIARVLGLGINKKNKISSKLNTIYDKGKNVFNEELGNVRKETKEVFDPAANAFRSFRRGMNGEWVETSGKAQTNADKAETKAQNDQMNKLGLTIGSAVGKIFGSNDKDTGEKKEGLLSKLFGKAKGIIGKVAKTAGLGLLGATVVAGIGHGSEFLFPKIEDMWSNKFKPWLNDTFNGLGDKLIGIKDGIVQLPGKIFNWMTGKSEGGGLPSLFKNHILPWYLDGFGAFATTFLPPIVSTIVKSIPALVKGIGKGVMDGVKALVFKDDKYHSDFDSMKVDTKVDSKAYSSKSNLSSVPSNGGTAWWKLGSSSSGSFDNMLGSLDGIMSGGSSGIQGKTKSERGKDQESYQSILDNPNSTENERQSAVAAAAANAAEYGPNGETLYNYKYMLKDKDGNTIDANGNYTSDNSNAIFDPIGGASSLQDRAFKGVTRRILTPGASNLPLKAVSGVGHALSRVPGHGLLTGGTRVAGRAMRGVGEAGQALTRVSDRVMGGIMTENVGNIAYKLGHRGKFARAGADAFTQNALERYASKGLLNVGEEIISESGSKFVVTQTEKGAKKVVQSSIGEVTENIASTGLSGKLSKFIKEGIEGIFNSTPVQKAITRAMESVGKVASNELIQKASTTIIGKLVKKAVDGLKTAAAAVVTKVSASLATANIAAVAFAAWDFGTGMSDARSILGLTKKQDISWTERIIAGFLKCINGFLTWGLLPESFIVDVFIEHLAPLLGVDVEEIQQRRDAATAEVTAHNDAMGTDYTIEEYNKRNSLGTKFMRGIKGLAGKSDANTVAEHNAANGTNLTLEEYEAKNTIGGKVGSAFKATNEFIGGGVSKAASTVGNLVKSGASSIKNFLDEKGITSAFTTFNSNIKQIFNCVKEGDPLGVFGVGLTGGGEDGVELSETVSNIAVTPIKIGTIVPAAVIGGIKGIISLIKPMITGFISVAKDFGGNAKLVGEKVLQGDIKGMLLAGNSFTDSEGYVDPSQLLANISTIPIKMGAVVPTLLIGGVKLLGKALKPVVNAVKNTASSTIGKLASVGGYVINGQPVELFKSIGDIHGEDGNIDIGKSIGSAITTSIFPTLLIPSLLVAGVKKIGEIISPIAKAIGSEASMTIEKFKGIGSNILDGNPGAILASITDIGTEEGDISPGKIIGSVITAGSLPLTLIPASIIGVGKLIGTAISGIVEKFAQNNELFETNKNAITAFVKKGDVSRVFNYKAETGEDNPFGFLQSASTFVSKFIYVPMAAFNKLGGAFDDLMKAGKEISVSDMINQMKEYSSKKKHPTMDGFDSIGKDESGGVSGILSNVVSGAVRAVGRPIISLLRGLSGISDLIATLKGDTDKAVEEVASVTTTSTSGTGKYGLGRVSQVDPRVSNVPFNSSGDSRKQTIGNSGCGPAAAVNAVNYAYGMGPSELIDASKYALNGGWKERNGGTKPGFFTSYLGKNGLKASHIGSSSVANSLASGSPVILMGKDGNGGNTPYGPNPHYVVAKGMDRNGNMIIDDPESMNPTSKYPAGKVLGKTSMAIKASKYGTGIGDYNLTSIYWDNDQKKSVTVVSPNLNISGSDMYKKQADAGTDGIMVGAYQGLFGSDKVGSYMTRYMKESTLNRIGYKRVPNKTTTTNTAAQPQTGFVATSVSQYDKDKLAFGTVGWLDIPYQKMVLNGSSEPNKVVNSIAKKYNITIASSDLNSTVRTILSKYFKCSTSAIEQFAKQIAPYAGITCSELRDKNNSMYLKLKGYAKTSYVAMYDDSSVGAICGLLGLRFEGDKPESAKYATADNSVSSSSSTTDDGSLSSDYYSNDSSGYSTETQEQSNPSIFDMIKTSFTNMFNYTDKDGNTKNLLSIFGLDSGSSSSSNSGSSSSSGYASGGLSTSQSKVKDLINSIMNKNQYNQGNRYRVGATLDGASQGSGDCSSTVQWALKNGANVDPGSNTREQIRSSNGQWVDGPYQFNQAASSQPDANKLALGDLMFYGKNGSSGYNNVSHVEMYWGDKKRVGHGSGIGPKISDYLAKGSSQRYLGAKRFIPVGSIGGSNVSIGNSSPTDIEKNKANIWKFLKSKGYNDIAAAGIMGNIGQECGFNYSLTQKGASNPGLGICQWTYASRKKAFLAAVPDWETNLPGQLNFLWSEINSSYKGCLPASMNQCTTVKDAVWKFHQIYEGSADIQKTGGLAKREGYGSQIYSQFANTSYGTTYATGKYGLGNVVDGQISSGFNDPTRVSHSGVDIASRKGSPVKSPTSGTVIRSEENAENGKMIVIRDDTGRLYTFTHLQSSNVRVGSRVASNTIIGTVGSTGNSSGDHLHYQMTDQEGQFIDPVAYAMGKKTASASKQSARAIGGSNGIDYTILINNIIQLLAIIGTNTEKINALVEAMAKLGVDTTGIDTTSNESKINAIKSSISNGMNRSQQAHTVTSEIESQRLEKMTSIMRNIAAQ